MIDTFDYNRLKYRMYFFVPYNISPIQQAIQAGHAALEYAWKYPMTPEYIDFMKNDKTWIILNGGTTNEHPDKLGSLNQIYITLLEHDALYAARNEADKMVRFSIFNEPDLNDALTAICFLADERVWDWENYPNFRDYLNNTPLDLETYPFLKSKRIKNKSDFSDETLIELFSEEYKKWTELVGGEKNVFIKNLIEGKKLA